MPRVPGQDTPARRELKVIDAVTRRLDSLDGESLDRVITWMDGLVDGDAETAEAEIKAMRAIAGVFQTIDADGRARAVRWLNEHYVRPGTPGNTDNGDGPRPL